MRLCWGEFELDEQRFELRCEGVKVPVQPKVLDLLRYVIRARDRVVLRSELFENVWPGVTVGEASLSRAVLEARRAIGDELQQVLVTVRGRGFRFVAEVDEKTEAVGGAPPPGASSDPTFVGRVSWTTCLDARLDEVFAGHGGLVWISGEAGIGKTRTLDEVARRASARGAAVHAASAHEAPASPQHWLWAQAARAHLASPGAGDELRARLAPLLAGTSTLTSEAQFVLFDLFARHFIDASRTRPQVFVLDDVHWADDGSRSLLQFFAKEIRHAAIVIIGTYRDTAQEVDARARAFRALLGECAGLAIPLRGLGLEEIARFVEVTSGSVPSESFTRALFDRTAGNPLYLGQVLQTKWAERALSETARQLASSMDLQQGLIESIRRHFDPLSQGARDLLTLAAILGREFELAELALVSGVGHGRLLDLLDEGVRGRVLLKSKGGAYGFTHALVQEVLYKALSSAERAAKHAHVAEALLAHVAGSVDAHVASLAYHFTRALPGGAPEQALEFSMRAARHAAARDDDRAAARHWADAARALGHLPADDRRHLVVVLGAAHAHARRGDPTSARVAFADAATLARTFAEPDAMADAALGFANVAGSTSAARVSLLNEARAMCVASTGAKGSSHVPRLNEALMRCAADDGGA
jgi:DNA-binding winged helix-turn-helix (wHTH) protein